MQTYRVKKYYSACSWVRISNCYLPTYDTECESRRWGELSLTPVSTDTIECVLLSSNWGRRKTCTLRTLHRIAQADGTTAGVEINLIWRARGFSWGRRKFGASDMYNNGDSVLVWSTSWSRRNRWALGIQYILAQTDGSTAISEVFCCNIEWTTDEIGREIRRQYNGIPYCGEQVVNRSHTKTINSHVL